MQFLHCDPVILTEFSASVKKCYQDLINLEKNIKQNIWEYVEGVELYSSWISIQFDQKSIWIFAYK